MKAKEEEDYYGDIRGMYRGILTGRHDEDVGAEATHHVGQPLADRSGEGALLEGRELVGDDAVHLGQVAKVLAIQDRGQTHVSGAAGEGESIPSISNRTGSAPGFG